MGQINVATFPKVTNLRLLIRNTEYSYHIGLDTRRILIRPRNAVILKMTFTAGESNSNYFEIRSDESWDSEEIYGDFDVFFQCDTDNVVVEILEWEQ